MRRKDPFFYYGGKLLSFLFSVFLLSLAAFYVARLAPGDPLVSYYGDRAEKMTVQERAQAESRLGLDQPIHVQYVRWLENALRGDFGISYKYKTDVRSVISARLPNTLLLGGVGFLLIFAGALALGAVCAWHEGTRLDRFLCRAGTIVSCIPEFWLALVLILVFAVRLRWLPSSGAYAIGGGGFIDRAVHLILPLTVTVAGHLWYYAYMIRNKLLEEVRADYVLLAKSIGLSRRAVLFRHCLRGVLPAYLSLMAISVPHILGGTYIVEMVFSYPGIGTLSYESARYQDYNLLMLLCIMSGGLVILCNILAQIVSERIDPRMRSEEPPEVTG
ncbi:MAG: ABC transporter permease [Oscillospiraceae bacterium]|nr:ABC transporter permease [Oscillospiraceae bacterium]